MEKIKNAHPPTLDTVIKAYSPELVKKYDARPDLMVK
jgi:hypothetical protein